MTYSKNNKSVIDLSNHKSVNHLNTKVKIDDFEQRLTDERMMKINKDMFVGDNYEPDKGIR